MRKHGNHEEIKKHGNPRQIKSDPRLKLDQSWINLIEETLDLNEF